MYHYSQFCKFFKEISNSLCAKQKFFLCGGTPWVKSLLVQQIEMVKSCFSQLVWPWRITTQKYLQDSPHINSNFGLSEKCLPYSEYVHTSNFFSIKETSCICRMCIWSYKVYFVCRCRLHTTTTTHFCFVKINVNIFFLALVNYLLTYYRKPAFHFRKTTLGLNI